MTKETRNKLNKSFARRIGKKLSATKQNLLTNLLPKYKFSKDTIITSNKNKKILEIGFGMGEHLFHQISLNPDNLYVGVEAYLNGIANFLKLTTENNNDNFFIWPDDLDIILNDIPDNSLDGIYILFPDPWHKRRQLKKRLVNKDRLNIFKLKLKSGGFINFASDIESYFDDVKKLFTEDDQFSIKNIHDFAAAHKDYVVTKYHKKAIKEDRKARFIQTELISI